MRLEKEGFFVMPLICRHIAILYFPSIIRRDDFYNMYFSTSGSSPALAASKEIFERLIPDGISDFLVTMREKKFAPQG